MRKRARRAILARRDLAPQRTRGANLLFVVGFAGEHFADAADRLALGIGEGEEFETVAQAIAIAHDGADLQRVRAERQGNFEGDDFPFLQFSGEGAPTPSCPSSVECPQQFWKLPFWNMRTCMRASMENAGSAALGRFGGGDFFPGAAMAQLSVVARQLPVHSGLRPGKNLPLHAALKRRSSALPFNCHEQVARFQGKFARDFYHGNAAVD